MKTKFFILFIVGIVLLVLGLGLFLGRDKSSSLDGFAQAIKNSGAEFYGAFWCPHCQDQKDEFGTAKKYLPYIECSKADSSQNDICNENKIESYPTWKFKDGLTIKSTATPIVCDLSTGDQTNQNQICKQISSEYFKTWYFNDYEFSIKSPADPISDGNIWKFPVGSMTTGKLPMSFIAEQIGYDLSK